MALQIEVTKVSVSEQMDKLWNITLNLKCTDDLVEVINQDFSVRYRPGQDIQLKTQELLEQMQESINNYIDEKQIFDATKLDDAVSWLQTNLVG